MIAGEVTTMAHPMVAAGSTLAAEMAVAETAVAEATKMILGLDHLQLALPAGAEDTMRAFYCDLLGFEDIAKPEPLLKRGGFWAGAGTIVVHFGIDPDFHPATKAHPAFLVCDIEALFAVLTERGYAPKWDTSLQDVVRFFVNDPVGNRVEIMQRG